MVDSSSAIRICRAVLHIFEKDKPFDKRLRNAIDCYERYCNGKDVDFLLGRAGLEVDKVKAFAQQHNHNVMSAVYHLLKGNFTSVLNCAASALADEAIPLAFPYDDNPDWCRAKVEALAELTK